MACLNYSQDTNKTNSRYLEKFRTHLSSLKQAGPTGETDEELKKSRRRLANKRNHLKLLIQYLDTDYAKIKESLTPMLKNGIITFELLWALWQPHTLAYTTTYGTSSEPRVFKVDMAQELDSILNGKYYIITGKYFEYDGKKFGYGSMHEQIPEFQGTRRISSLPVYPLQYHQNESQLRADLIDRGKKFVSLGGVQYKAYQGIAFQKRKKGQTMKYHVQKSRIMVDPAIFRRINPNYCISAVKSKDPDIISDDETSDSDDENDCCCDSDDSESNPKKKTKFVTKYYKNSKGDVHGARIPEYMVKTDEPEENLDAVPTKKEGEKQEQQVEEDKDKAPKTKPIPQFTDEEYLIASPVLLGFSFSEKQWLELAVSKVKEIKWNDKAWDSLVLEKETKDLIKALVESRTYHAASTIDDVIQGKGKGLVSKCNSCRCLSLSSRTKFLQLSFMDPPELARHSLLKVSASFSSALCIWSRQANSVQTHGFLKPSCRRSLTFVIRGEPSCSSMKRMCFWKSVICTISIETHLSVSSCGSWSIFKEFCS